MCQNYFPNIYTYACLVLVDLCTCYEDVAICLLGWCCSCYLYGQNAEQIDGSNKISACIGYACAQMCCAGCLLHKPKRQLLRATYNLEEKPSDLLASCCCAACAHCQEAREMQVRGEFIIENMRSTQIYIHSFIRCSTGYTYSSHQST